MQTLTTTMTTDTEAENDTYHAKLALSLMQKYAISPIPENYSVWFHYAMGKNTNLVREVDNIINNSLKFTQETSSYLHNKFILASQSQQVVDDAAINAENVLTEVLKAINEFSGETQNYNKGVDDYIETIGTKFENSNVKDIIKGLISATATLKQHGQKVTQKLEESTKEINALKKNLQQVTVESQRDFLTGVFNRKTFEKYADEQMATARENNSELCLLMIDIDHFKTFNDRFGHLLGDEVLKIVARTLTETLKGRDAVARFGGEEFIVILPETPIGGAMKVADIIRTTIAGKELKRKDTGETYGTITVSMGVALFRPEIDTLPLMIKRADDALYVSKRNGRNRITREALQ